MIESWQLHHFYEKLCPTECMHVVHQQASRCSQVVTKATELRVATKATELRRLEILDCAAHIWSAHRTAVTTRRTGNNYSGGQGAPCCIIGEVGAVPPPPPVFTRNVWSARRGGVVHCYVSGAHALASGSEVVRISAHNGFIMNTAY